MTRDEIKERIIRLPSGGIITDETRFDARYVYSIIDTFRARVIQAIYQKDKRINPQYYQKFYPEFDKDRQDNDCCVKFFCPEVISLDTMSDGFRYIGTIDNSEGFRRVHSRARLSNYNKHRVMNVNHTRAISALYDGNDMNIEIYGNKDLEELMVEGLFSSPSDIPTYNPYVDHYPMAEGDIPMMEDMILKAQTNIIMNVTPDTLSDSTDLAQRVSKAVNRR